MWDTPIYRLNRLAGSGQDGRQRYENIVIDVTRSAPPFKGPGKTLAGVLRKVTKIASLTKTADVLDFGAGKLRNTLFLLNEGYKTCAVEYEELFKDSAQAAGALASAEKYKNRFCKLVYPRQFEASAQKFDLALLINVLNIMPIPAERLLVLRYCHAKLRKGGHLLWYTQRGDADYTERLVPKYALGDGHYIGKNAKYKTFYREFPVAEIDTMLEQAGFEFVSAIPATSRNQARLYRKSSDGALADVLSPAKISAAQVVDPKIPNPTGVKPRVVTTASKKRIGDPNPQALKVENLLVERLSKIRTGKKSAGDYQKHVRDIISALFSPAELRNLRLEKDIFGSRKRLDILASNKSRSGFFYSLKADQSIRCPTIVIECKNYKHDIGNPEFDQLGSRLGKKLGLVGILAYRRSTKDKAMFDRCRDFFNNEEKLIIPLSDKDFVTLLKLKMESNDSEIENFLDERVLDITAG